MKKLYSIIIIAFINISCNINKNHNQIDIRIAIPIDSDLIIKFYDIQKMGAKIKYLNWWKELQNTPIFKDQINKISELNKLFKFNHILNNKNIYVSTILTGDNKANFLLTTSMNKDLENDMFKLLGILDNRQNKKREYEGVVINNIKINTTQTSNTHVFFAIYQNIFLMSFSDIIIEKSIRQLKHGVSIFESESITKLDKNLPKYSDLNILVKTEFLEQLIDQKNIFLNSNSWSCFDVEL